MHVVTIGSLTTLGVVEPLGPVYLAGVAGWPLLLAWEQSLVTESDLSQVKRAFDLNGWVGTVVLCHDGHGDLLAMTPPRRIAVAVTGASGVLYAVRTIAALL